MRAPTPTIRPTAGRLPGTARLRVEPGIWRPLGEQPDTERASLHPSAAGLPRPVARCMLRPGCLSNPPPGPAMHQTVLSARTGGRPAAPRWAEAIRCRRRSFCCGDHPVPATMLGGAVGESHPDDAQVRDGRAGRRPRAPALGRDQNQLSSAWAENVQEPQIGPLSPAIQPSNWSARPAVRRELPSPALGPATRAIAAVVS